MAYMVGLYLQANSFNMPPTELHLHYIERPGGEIHTYAIPLPPVPHDQDDADDSWIRDLLVAAIEAL